MKNKLIALCIFMSFLTISFCLFDSVSAVDITYRNSFEGVSGTDYSSSNMTTFEYSADFDISATSFRTGSKSLGMQTASASGWFNFTSVGSQFLTNWSVYFNPSSAAGSSMYLYFYNNTNQGSFYPLAPAYDKALVTIRYCVSDTQFHYVDDVGATHVISTGGTSTWLNKYGFHVDDDIGTVTYYKYATGVYSEVVGGASSPTGINSLWVIDRLFVVKTAGVVQNYYFDDMEYEVADSYMGGSSSCGITLTDYDKLGIDNTPYTSDLTYPVFQKINYGLNYGYLAYITLCVNPTMYYADPDPNNYNLEVIGFDLGGADCYELDGYQYRLIWEVGIDLGERVEGIPSGRNIDCFFTHSTVVSGISTYWKVCIGSNTDTDLDSDGNTNFKLWNSARTIIDYDVGVSFYFDPTTRWEAADSTYTDSLGLHNYVSKNTNDTYNYDINQPEGIVCSYLLSQTSAAYNNKIVVMRNTTTYIQNFTSLSFPSGVIGFIPSTIGKYTFKLYNYHYVYNITAFVTGTANNYFISSNPTITNPYERYNIYYRYYNPIGTSGNIGIYTDFTKRGSFVYANPSFPVDSNTSTSIPYNSNSLTNEFLTLFVNYSLNTPVAYATHYIRDNNVLENNIYVSPAELGIYRGNPDGYSISILGSHLYVGCMVSIFINGREQVSVRDEQQFNVEFAPTNPDYYNISLRLFQNDSWVTLKYCFLTVSDLGADSGEGGANFLTIDPPFSYFAAIFLIIVTTLSPMLIIGAVKKDMRLDTIPQFLYLIMSIVGFIITIILGWFPAWSILVLVVLAALIMAIMWLKGQGKTIES